MKQNLRAMAKSGLMAKTSEQKTYILQTMNDFVKAASTEMVAYAQRDSAVQSIETPGRPDAPELIHPRKLKPRKLSTAIGRAAFIHAIAHIEFNAINLALDAIYRFDDMPNQYYCDWLKVATEEAYHHSLLTDLLSSTGYQYGDFPAHNGLWDMACQTDGDILSRMALIPCVFEARGLDVTPSMITKFSAMGDPECATVLKKILDDEVGHVALGMKWYLFVCEKQQRDPQATFVRLVEQFMPGKQLGPFDLKHRVLAGFSESFLDYLQQCGLTQH